MIVLLMVLWAVGSLADLTGDRVPLGLFSLANVAILAYGVSAFIGWRRMADDIRGQVRAPGWLRRGLPLPWSERA
jgi:hypothetical protein